MSTQHQFCIREWACDGDRLEILARVRRFARDQGEEPNTTFAVWWCFFGYPCPNLDRCEDTEEYVSAFLPPEIYRSDRGAQDSNREAWEKAYAEHKSAASKAAATSPVPAAISPVAAASTQAPTSPLSDASVMSPLDLDKAEDNGFSQYVDTDTEVDAAAGMTPSDGVLHLESAHRGSQPGLDGGTVVGQAGDVCTSAGFDLLFGVDKRGSIFGGEGEAGASATDAYDEGSVFVTARSCPETQNSGTQDSILTIGASYSGFAAGFSTGGTRGHVNAAGKIYAFSDSCSAGESDVSDLVIEPGDSEPDDFELATLILAMTGGVTWF